MKVYLITCLLVWCWSAGWAQETSFGTKDADLTKASPSCNWTGSGPWQGTKTTACIKEVTAYYTKKLGAAQAEKICVALSSGNAQGTNEACKPVNIDVRYTTVDSRPLTDAEMSTLRNSLRRQPETATLTRGETAQSNLVDDKNQVLGSVLIRWEASSQAQSQSQGRAPAKQSFTIQVENHTSCAFLSSAELDDNRVLLSLGCRFDSCRVPIRTDGEGTGARSLVLVRWGVHLL